MIDDDDFEYLKNFRFYIAKGYPAAYFNKQKNGARSARSLCVHRAILDIPKGFCADHINRNKLDNRKINLRIVSTKVNVLNSSLIINNGVKATESGKRFMATVCYNGKNKRIGTFDTREEAYEARKKFLNNLHGPGIINW